MQQHIIMMAALAARYKDIWKSLDSLRARRGAGTLPDWPAYCFLPSGLCQALCHAFQEKGGKDAYPDGDWLSLACLGAWRPGQDVFRFAPELFEALTTTPLTTLPTEVLFRLPAWCIYIETGGVDWIGDDPMRGFFAWLDSDGPDLFLVPDYEGMRYTPFAVRLSESDISAVLRAGITERSPLASPDASAKFSQYIACCEKMLSLLLYLCSVEPDVVDTAGNAAMPTAPAPVHTKKAGWRLFPPDKPVVWHVGETISRELRAAQEQGGHHVGPRPHIRRAHWHGFWSGTLKPKEGVEPTPRRFDLRWMPPIAVALKDDE